jgi:NADH-quinone oxidoreductase subunit L
MRFLHAGGEVVEASTAHGWFLDNGWLIPVIPAVGFFVIILFGKRGRALHTNFPALLGLGSMLGSFVLSLGAAVQWISAVNSAHSSEGEVAIGRAVGAAFLRATEEEGPVPYVAPVIHQWTWWQSGGIEFTWGTHLDGLSLCVLVVVGLIASLVQLYSIEYVRDDRRFTHFFAALTLFAAGMMTMVLAESTVQFLLGWEIMGLCSFMLIGHWWEEYPNARAALKAFFTVRVGDTGLLIGLAILFFGSNDWINERFPGTGGGFSIQGLSAWALSGEASHSTLLAASVFLFIAVIGKSGQFPLHTWLPDAMAGPTPVSSLLHSSTMVVAGVFLVARFYPVFWEGMSITDSPVNFVVLIGGVTILIAAALAFVQNDIKKVLAYSTVSQLGYMIMGLGAGAWMPAVFHIFTHAFFKACLFLGAGSVSHSGSHHSFDMKQDMGGLKKHMPITFWTFVLSTIALAGIIPFSGFWSKDEILAYSDAGGYRAFLIIGLIGAVMTAAYMTRAVYLTFLGEPRGAAAGVHHDDAHGHDAHASHGDDHGHDAHGHDAHGSSGPHESGWLITTPLVILAGLATISGGLLIPPKPFEIELFKKWVEPSYYVVDGYVPGGETGEGGEEAIGRFVGMSALPLIAADEEGGEEGTEEAVPISAEEAGPLPAGEYRFFPEVIHPSWNWPKALLGVGLALGGGAVSYAVCSALYTGRRYVGLTRKNKLLGAGYTFLVNKYYLDALYEKVIVRGLVGPIAKAAYWINQNVLDAVVNATGLGGKLLGRWVYRNIDQRGVDGVVNGVGIVSSETGGALRGLQSGKVQQYGALLFGAAAVGAIVLVLTV